MSERPLRAEMMTGEIKPTTLLSLGKNVDSDTATTYLLTYKQIVLNQQPFGHQATYDNSNVATTTSPTCLVK